MLFSYLRTIYPLHHAIMHSVVVRTMMIASMLTHGPPLWHPRPLLQCVEGEIDQKFSMIQVSWVDGHSCNELQSNLIMINHYDAFYHKIPNKNVMSIVKMKSMYVYRSYPNSVLMLPSLHHSMTKILNILFSRILYLFMGL